MELEFEKSSVAYIKPVLRELQTQEQTQEIKLTEGMPDIGRVLAGWGQVILRSKEWRGDSIAFSGGVMVWILYAPEDGGETRCMESWLPFQMKWDIGGNPPEGNIRIRCLLRFVDARSVSARKIMVRCGVGAVGEAWISDREQIGSPGELPEDVQLLKATYPVRLPKEAGEKTFLMDEDLTFPGSAPEPGKLVYYTITPELTEKKVLANKAVFRGNACLHILYTTEQGSLHNWDFELPFSQYAELEGEYSTDAAVDFQMAVTSLELELDGEGHLRLKCGLLAQYVVDDREMLELVEDAYSPTRTLEPEFEQLELPAVLERKRETVLVKHALNQDANHIIDVEYLPDFPRNRRGEGVQLELPGQFQVLYYGEDGSVQAATARTEGDWSMPSDGECQVSADIHPGKVEAVAGSGIALKAEPVLHLTARAKQGLPMVTGIRLGEEKEVDLGRPSLILRRAGTARLWDIAKSTGSTVESIKKANGLTAEPVADQILLIPVS